MKSLHGRLSPLTSGFSYVSIFLINQKKGMFMIDFEKLQTNLPPQSKGAAWSFLSKQSIGVAIHLDAPSEKTIDAIFNGEVEIKVMSFGESGFFALRFPSAASPADGLIVPFHVGKAPLPLRGLPKPDPTHRLVVCLFDVASGLLGGRIIQLQPETSDQLEKIAFKQNRLSRRESWSETMHSDDVARFVDTYPTFEKVWAELGSTK